MTEDTPLLENTQTEPERRRTPLPWSQFSIVLLIQHAEAMSHQAITPFLPQLIKDIGVTCGKDSRVGYYVGLMHSLFFLSEACMVFQWSRISDQIGRKPIVLTGFFGISISMLCFGLSRAFWSLIISRCLSGVMGGCLVVMKSMLVEMTDETNAAQAWAILSLAWCIGMAMGPLIGGSLARPAERFPELFGGSAIYKEYPYFLPCSVLAAITALSWFIIVVFMKETANPPMTPRQYFFGGATKHRRPTANSAIHDDRPTPASRTENKQLPMRSLLVRPVLLATASYATLALTEIAFRAVFPVFYAMPIEMGGLSLDPATIGAILGVLGILNGVTQVVFFARMFSWLGPKMTFFVCTSAWLPMVVMFPVINALARVYGLNSVSWLVVSLQLGLYTLANSAFSVALMYVSAAAPDEGSIGATNGLAQTVVSVMRAVGPVLVNSVFSFGVENKIMRGHFVYWVMAGMVGLTLCVGSRLPRDLGRGDRQVGKRVRCTV